MTDLQEKKSNSDKISVAPMLDWTDRHFRFFLRLICRRAMLYTEMVACPALILGDRHKLLAYNKPAENPLVLQVGGSEPALMAQCAQMAEEYGYQGININAGCPSSRVQAGRFGAILMKAPEIVADCVADMRAKAHIPVSVKTRISLVDVGGDGFSELFRFATLMREAGCEHLIIHARQAKLNISPKDNRQRLPLNYDVVYRLKKSFPDMFISINGNVLSLDDAESHLAHVNGVMIGRWAYGNPYGLADVDRRFFGDNHPVLSRREVLESFLPYLETHQDQISIIGTHLLGLYHGQPNAKAYKQAITSRDLTVIKDLIKTL